MSTTCPVCGSADIKTITKVTSLKEVYGQNVNFEEKIDCCSVCEECGDFSGENEARIVAAIEVAKKNLMCSILDDLSGAGVKMSYLERALDLPARTVSRWKSGETSAASIALLRCIHSFPWMLEVADARFDPQVAQMKVVEAASRVLHMVFQPHTEKASASVVVSQDDYTVNVDARVNFKFNFAPQIKILHSDGV